MTSKASRGGKEDERCASIVDIPPKRISAGPNHRLKRYTFLKGDMWYVRSQEGKTFITSHQLFRHISLRAESWELAKRPSSIHRSSFIVHHSLFIIHCSSSSSSPSQCFRHHWHRSWGPSNGTSAAVGSQKGHRKKTHPIHLWCQRAVWNTSGSFNGGKWMAFIKEMRWHFARMCRLVNYFCSFQINSSQEFNKKLGSEV